mgnify:CR=1 FL=1
MQKGEAFSEKLDKKLAAVCGLFCGACSWFIATTEDPARLKKLAAQRQYTEEEGRCYGCRSDKRLPYCGDCSLFACAEQQGIDFCSLCEAYPCADLKQFQSAMPHRIELWTNLERIRTVGYKQWLKEVRENYLCPRCQTMNSTYDLKCRTCGEEPSCRYVGKHKPVIERYVKNR